MNTIYAYCKKTTQKLAKRKNKLKKLEETNCYHLAHTHPDIFLSICK